MSLEKLARFLTGGLDVVVDGLPRLLRQFRSDGPTSLPLSHRRAIDRSLYLLDANAVPMLGNKASVAAGWIKHAIRVTTHGPTAQVTRQSHWVSNRCRALCRLRGSSRLYRPVCYGWRPNDA